MQRQRAVSLQDAVVVDLAAGKLDTHCGKHTVIRQAGALAAKLTGRQQLAPALVIQLLRDVKI